MKKIILLYIPGITWHEIIAGVDQKLLPGFDKLITQGTIGQTTKPAPATPTNEASTIITGTPAEKHCCVQPHEVDPNNFALQAVTRRSIEQPLLSELCNSNDIPTALINWPGSHNQYGQQKQPLVISDYFVQSCAFTKEFRHITLESVSDDAFTTHASQLLFHEDEVDSELLDFFGITPKSMVIDIFKQQFAACVTTHNITTYLLEHNQHNLLCCHYDFFEKVQGHDGFRKETKSAMIRYLDIMLSSILDYISSDPERYLLLYSGGRNTEPGFFAVHGPSINPDHLIKKVKAEQIAPTIMDIFGLSCSHFQSKPIDDIHQKNASIEKYIRKVRFTNEVPKTPTYKNQTKNTNKQFLVQKALLISENFKQQAKYKELTNYLSFFAETYDDQLLKLALVEALLLNKKVQEASKHFQNLNKKTKQMEQGLVLALWLELEEKQADKTCLDRTGYSCEILAANTLRRFSTLLIMHKRWSQALTILQNKKLQGENDPHREHLKSICFFHLEKYEKAETAIKNALKTNVGVGSYWLHLGKIYLAQKEIPKSTDALLTAIKYDSRLYEAKEYLKEML